MSDTKPVHLKRNHNTDDDPEVWCDKPDWNDTADITKATCLSCLLACAEYGSEARHRREVLIEAGAK